MANQISVTLPSGEIVVGDAGFCRSCKAAIVWTITKNGKRAPTNLDGTSHWGTCPDAQAWRDRYPKAAPK